MWVVEGVTEIWQRAEQGPLISILFRVFFCSFIWAIFLSWCACYVKGQSLIYSPEWVNAHSCTVTTVTLYVGEGPTGSNGACSTLYRFAVTPSTTHNHIGPFWCCFPSGWVCVRSRTLWVSPTNSPARLGVSPTAASTPTGVFNQWFETLFPRAGTLGFMVCYPVYQLLPHWPTATLPTLLHNLPPR